MVVGTTELVGAVVVVAAEPGQVSLSFTTPSSTSLPSSAGPGPGLWAHTVQLLSTSCSSASLVGTAVAPVKHRRPVTWSERLNTSLEGGGGVEEDQVHLQVRCHSPSVPPGAGGEAAQQRVDR